MAADISVRIACAAAHGENVGTGFFVSSRHVVTCAHVLAGANENPGDIRLTSRGKDLTPIRIHIPSTEIDVAIIEVSAESSRISALMEESLQIGDLLYVFGFPARLDGAGDSITFEYEGPTLGRSSAHTLHKIKKGQAEPGFSGSAVINVRTGAVCGVLKSTRDRSSDLGGRLVSVESLRNFAPEMWLEHLAHNSASGAWRSAQRGSATLLSSLDRYLTSMEKACSRPAIPWLAPTSDCALEDIFVPIEFSELTTSQFDVALRPADPLQVAQMSCGLVVVCGGPGSGKSTTVRKWALDLIRDGAQVTSSTRTIPYFLTAAAFEHARGAGPSPNSNPQDRALQYGSRIFGDQISLDSLLSLSTARIVVFVDGYDEAGSDVRDSIREFLDGLILLKENDKRKVSAIVTSRTQIARRELGSSARYFEIQPLRRGSQEEIAKKWREIQGSEGSSNLLNIGGDLLSTPLMLSIALSLQQDDLSRPEGIRNLATLYGRLVVEACRRWDERDNADARLGREAIDALAFIASEHLERKESTIPWLRDALRTYYRSRMNRSLLVAGRDSEEFLLTLRSGQGMFLTVGGNGFSWLHLSFRDFLAASYLVDAGSIDASELADRHSSMDARLFVIFVILLSPASVAGRVVSQILASDRITRFEFLEDLLLAGYEMQDPEFESLVLQLVEAATNDREAYSPCAALFSPHRHPFEILLRIPLNNDSKSFFQGVSAGNIWDSRAAIAARNKLSDEMRANGEETNQKKRSRS